MRPDRQAPVLQKLRPRLTHALPFTCVSKRPFQKKDKVSLIHSAQRDHACKQTALGVLLQPDRRHQSQRDLWADDMAHFMYDSLYKDPPKT